MTICKECGVELEDDMDVCPLCEKPVVSSGESRDGIHQEQKRRKPEVGQKYVLQQVLWQITSVLLLSAIVATVIINVSTQKRVTWSIYPVSICLMVFSYASLMALWRTRIRFQLLVGWLISSLVLLVVHFSIEADWPLSLALPILSAVNVTALLLNLVWINIKSKGLNILAIIFVAIAVLCLVIEGITSFYLRNSITLQWSVVVAACLLPVTAVIFFMYFRTRNNSDIQKIFHT